MNITLDKKSYTVGKVDWNYDILLDGTHVGFCMVEVMNGKEEDLFERFQHEEEHNCLELLERVKEIHSPYLLNKFAFVRLIELDPVYQKKGIGRKAFAIILEEIKQEGFEIVILDAFRGGFLIPFYESFGFARMPETSEQSAPHSSYGYGENFMWKFMN